jgi:hypothetical protein
MQSSFALHELRHLLSGPQTSGVVQALVAPQTNFASAGN